MKGKLTFAGEIIQRFFQVRGEVLNEKNPKWLNNDYLKFIAFAMHQIEQTGAGVLGYASVQAGPGPAPMPAGPLSIAPSGACAAALLPEPWP